MAWRTSRRSASPFSLHCSCLDWFYKHFASGSIPVLIKHCESDPSKTQSSPELRDGRSEIVRLQRGWRKRESPQQQRKGEEVEGKRRRIWERSRCRAEGRWEAGFRTTARAQGMQRKTRNYFLIRRGRQRSSNYDCLKCAGKWQMKKACNEMFLCGGTNEGRLLKSAWVRPAVQRAQVHCCMCTQSARVCMYAWSWKLGCVQGEVGFTANLNILQRKCSGFPPEGLMFCFLCVFVCKRKQTGAARKSRRLRRCPGRQWTEEAATFGEYLWPWWKIGNS